jgi:uncharacterized protein YqiB (DUF1249 family)
VINETNLPASWRARPRGFIALMGLYESNYLRLSRLAGNLAALAGQRQSSVTGDCELLLEVLERCPFTTVAHLTYLMPDAERTPELRLRIYHDAHLVEAGWSHASARTERELVHRWAPNMMLNKWLEYCLDRGHRLAHPVVCC